MTITDADIMIPAEEPLWSLNKSSDLLYEWVNGNAKVRLYGDGTRYVEHPDEGLQLDWPLNIDIRISSRCALGMNPATGKASCAFCHESARTDGVEGDYIRLMDVLRPLPSGVELAIGVNHWSHMLDVFLNECRSRGHVCNVTVNQKSLPSLLGQSILSMVERGVVHGVGVSYRPGSITIPGWMLSYNNMVVHVIAGIDSIHDVIALSKVGVRKILVLGEKDFGFNQGKVDLSSKNHKDWVVYLPELFDKFEVVSFDNLALEQVRPERFFSEDLWSTIHQGEYSFYINAVTQTFHPSSRSPLSEPYGDIKSYFAKLKEIHE